MKRSFLVIAILLAVACTAILITQNVTDAQRPDRTERPGGQQAQRQGGPGGRMGAMIGPEALMRGMSFDRTWMALSFEMDTTDEQLVQARAAYAKAWKSLQEQGKALREEMSGEQDREAMRAVFEKMRPIAREIQAELDASLKEALTDEQYQKLGEVRKAEQEQMQQQLQRQRQRSGDGANQPGARPGRSSR